MGKQLNSEVDGVTYNSLRVFCKRKGYGRHRSFFIPFKQKRGLEILDHVYSILLKDCYDDIKSKRGFCYTSLWIVGNLLVTNASDRPFLLFDRSWYSMFSTLNCARIRQALALYQKNAGLPGVKSEEELNLEALEKFLAANDRNLFRSSFLNDKLVKWLHFQDRNEVSSANFTSSEAQVLSIIDRAVEVCNNILGDLPSFDELRFRFSNGACASAKNTEAHLPYKFDETIDYMAPEQLHFVTGVLKEVAGMYQPYAYICSKDERKVYADSIFCAVDKNVQERRPIAKQHALLVAMQKMIGVCIKQRLAEVCINLTDQSINAGLAKEASVTGRLATVDLSNASGSICRTVVYYFTYNPDAKKNWFSALNILRAKDIDYNSILGNRERSDKRYVTELHEFSSMGNGYTFELESLIFYSVCVAVLQQLEIPYVTGKTLSVYGDDIIIDTKAVPLLTEVFTFLGFSINEKKTFSSGPFRESCGNDCLRGVNIRPFYVKDKLSEHKVVSLLNYCNSADVNVLSTSLIKYLLSILREKDYYTVPSMEHLEKVKKGKLPRDQFKLESLSFGPPGYGDGYIHDPNACYINDHKSGLYIWHAAKIIDEELDLDKYWMNNPLTSRNSSLCLPLYLQNVSEGNCFQANEGQNFTELKSVIRRLKNVEIAMNSLEVLIQPLLHRSLFEERVRLRNKVDDLRKKTAVETAFSAASMEGSLDGSFTLTSYIDSVTKQKVTLNKLLITRDISDIAIGETSKICVFGQEVKVKNTSQSDPGKDWGDIVFHAIIQAHLKRAVFDFSSRSCCPPGN